MAKIVHRQMPSLQELSHKSSLPRQKLGCKSPRVRANFWCKYPEVRAGGGGGWLWMKLIPALSKNEAANQQNGMPMGISREPFGAMRSVMAHFFFHFPLSFIRS